MSIKSSTDRTRLGTVGTAMVTPFDSYEALDLGAAVAVAEHLVATGTDSLILAGTTGESPSLEPDESLALFRAVKDAIGSRAVVIAGTGSFNTHHAAEFSKRAEQCGVDAILSVAPYYSRPPQDGLRRHFSTVAQATSLPIVIYNIQSRTAVNIAPATMMALANDHANIAGVKESSGDFAQMTEILRTRPPGFVFFSGDDHLFLPSLAIGGDGVISVASHVAGAEIRAMYEAFRAGERERAAAIHTDLAPLFAALFAAPSPIPVKYAMRRLGFAVGGCRSPLGEMPKDLAERLEPMLARHSSMTPT